MGSTGRRHRRDALDLQGVQCSALDYLGTVYGSALERTCAEEIAGQRNGNP